MGRRYWLAWAATLTFFGGFYALLVPLPRHLAEAGLSDVEIGLVLSAFGAAALAGRPLAGIAADRWGARAVMLAGAALLAAGSAAVPLARGLAPLFGLRVLQAAGYVCFTTAGTGLVAALSGDGERGRRMAIYGAAANVAMTSAPAATSFLLGGPLTVAQAFLLAAGLAAAAGALALLTGPSARPAGGGRARWRVPRATWPALGVAALLSLSFGAFFQFAPIMADRRGGLPAGALYTIYGIGIIASRLLGGRWLDRLGAAGAIRVAAPLLAAGSAGLALSGSPLVTAPAVACIAAGSGVFHPALLASIARQMPEAPGRAAATFYIAFDLGLGLGSALLGAALEAAGVAGLFGAASAAALAALALAPALGRAESPSPAPAASAA